MAMTEENKLAATLGWLTGEQHLAALQAEQTQEGGRFCGKTVLVTGAGSGIGFAICEALAREGAQIIANDLPTQNKLAVLKSTIEARGGTCTLKLGDVSDPQTAAKIFADIETLDVLVNNAGYLAEVPLSEMTDAQWDQMIKVHLYGSFYFARGAVGLMRRQGFGRIINIASDLGQIGCQNLAHYSAAKGGIIALTKSLARELGGQGILVNAVAPGGILTPLVGRLGDEYIENEAKLYPLNRLGLPSEIAAVVLFLASNAATFMTGQVVGVNGGGVMNG
ncbi:SDR family NAD(P)-dependent oxidoreductase [Acidocella sp. KAb 2-4]|uniref:SDR family NAD(P)-dependent oxidoreductase n=1 Tax=Acidocella sp. KAb 2-4 TaxID=2885158 RepID=UPI001D07A03A|nr:SDR family oxidoreductase [Acidocella sp. KAb 2-4]MCB5944388.1 SDR family oxidoreductase [Acidocella sp. KAb 2-4]